MNSLFKDPEIIKYLEADKKLLQVGAGFKLLTTIEWPKNIQNEFLESFNSGNPKIPTIEYAKKDFSAPLKELEDIMKTTETEHPIAQYIHQTAKSYFTAHKLVENLGKPEMLQYSIELYGSPIDKLAGSSYTNLDAAKFFVEISDQFDEYTGMGEQDICVLAETIKAQIEEEIKKVFVDDPINVIIDEKLVPKAAAGVSRIRLKSGTCFSAYDFKQLLEHEVFVHTLTAINGKHQFALKSLGLGSPRTTGTQEGLATFAELITGSIDLSRLKRIALRGIAIDMAINGANFIEVFNFFKSQKQSDSESFSSAQRIFRGGDPNGKYVFTKDSVYLDGLLRTHSFFRWAMKAGKMSLTKVLFTGRMTFEDAVKLEPFVDQGLITAPKYLPPWLTQIPTLGGYLAFSLFANKIRVGGLDKEFSPSNKT